MDTYAVGRRLKLHASIPNLMTNQLNSMSFDVEIMDRLSVARRSSSQILKVRIDNIHPSEFLAKCYDPTLCRTDIWPYTPSAFCKARIETEVKAYRRLKELQAMVLPTNYGEYQYRTDVPSTYRSMGAILIEYVSYPTLECLQPEDLTSDERGRLISITLDSLRRCQSLGVYHRDIRASNVIFSKDRAFICDWEHATFGDDATLENPRNWKVSDSQCHENENSPKSTSN